ncbi:MAG: hypothetical protein AABW54_00925 [Candidatus Micrarchaeota archaeon]
MKPRKLSVGFYGVTGCAGCQLSVLFNEDEILELFGLVDVKAFPFVRERNIDKSFDVAFIEGLVASQDDVVAVKKLREKSKVLVALGACSHTGCVPAYRKFAPPADFERLQFKKRGGITDVPPSPVDAFVKVDYVIPGCPPCKKEILKFIKDFAAGRLPKACINPVCVECRRNGNACLLEGGKPCLGPVTVGGCDAVCVNGGFECWGCRGALPDANYRAFAQLLQGKGFSKKFILQRLRSFVGLKLPREAEEALE